VYNSMFQFLPTSSNIAQQLKRSGTTFHRPQSTTLYEGDVSCHVKHWWVFLSTPLLLFLKVSVTNRCIFVFPIMWNP
jgi:hypothetical protein